MRARPQSEEVVVADSQIVTVNRSDIDFLKAKARGNARKRMRLCAHKEITDRLHEMLIVHEKNTYVRPHRHQNKSESFHVIEGEANVVIFDEQGRITDVIRMGEYGSGHEFYYRISDPLYHTLLIRSEVLVFHEITNGPFKSSDNQFAPWSPDGHDEQEVRTFLTSITRLAEEFRTPAPNH